jgi:hypothetical protein
MDSWTEGEKKVIDALDTPWKVQEFLDSMEYNPGSESRSPRLVLETRRAHCFEGALFAAACLRNMGSPPLLVDLRAVNDDDHVIAVFRKRGLWGAVAKSNFTTLRFREPVYRNLRELSMSYFDLYFNTLGKKTLREYSRPMDLSKYDGNEWMTTESSLEFIGDDLDRVRHYPLIDDISIKNLSAASPLLLESGLLGSKPEGLYKPDRGRE